jgi:hypothetical protein
MERCSTRTATNPLNCVSSGRMYRITIWLYECNKFYRGTIQLIKCALRRPITLRRRIVDSVSASQIRVARASERAALTCAARQVHGPAERRGSCSLAHELGRWRLVLWRIEPHDGTCAGPTANRPCKSCVRFRVCV